MVESTQTRIEPKHFGQFIDNFDLDVKHLIQKLENTITVKHTDLLS